MTRTGLVAVGFGLAAIALVLVVVPGMRDSGFIIQAYGVTAIVVAGYAFLLARKLDQAEKARDTRER